jgi:hypothetical protein
MNSLSIYYINSCMHQIKMLALHMNSFQHMNSFWWFHDKNLLLYRIYIPYEFTYLFIYHIKLWCINSLNEFISFISQYELIHKSLATFYWPEEAEPCHRTVVVGTFWRLHSLDQLCSSIVYQCAKVQCKIPRMKETSFCGFWKPIKIEI